MTIAAVAASTERVRLGVMVCILARRRPQKVARETASLDLLSGGRLVFGAGLGSQWEEEFAAFGEDPDPRVRAARLDEGLDIVSGLWSGEPFSYSGAHYEVAETTFLPTPLQRPRIPVWIAGRWPAPRPFRRAARWDGVFAIHREVSQAQTMTPEQLAEIVSYTLAHRASDSPFDFVIEGQTAGDGGAGDRERVEGLRAAGLTWWIENLGWFRGPLESMRERIDAGPPRAG
jgi:alkanesulfonate monooxygenase SsuD/methylene tetrahydromethanopterin reductase-like flavin-dependent oxidoreductase (luciferase family)